jgi:hypothetical protein
MAIQTYAVLDGEDVTNIILWDDIEDEYEAPEGLTVVLAPEEVSIGWKRSLDEWIAPVLPEPEPQPTEDPVVTAAKNTAVAQLMALGITEPVARTIVGLPPA